MLVSKSYAISTGTWYDVKLVVEGTSIRLYVNGVLQLSATDSSLSTGAIGLITQGGANAKYDESSSMISLPLMLTACLPTFEVSAISSLAI